MRKREKGQHVYILDYFLDGYFLKWEEVEGNCPVYGQEWVVSRQDGTEVVTKVVGTEPISEHEHRIFLCSCGSN